MSIPFVGKRFTPAAFAAYVNGLDWSGGWRGQYPVLHHTAAPSLATRPNGLSDQHLLNLLDYYQNQLKWSGAPHLFIDDREDGIIVFQRLDRRGVHAKSFNAAGWGIEMLGDYDTEDPTTGRGAKVLGNAAHALQTLLSVNNGRPSDIRFHRDDPQTTKTCPGSKVSKAMVASLVAKVEVIVTPIVDSQPITAKATVDTPDPWAAEAWAWADEMGLMSGNPHGPVDRQTLAVVLHRYHREQENK